MFEQDYIMRLIKEMVRAILKLIFNLDTDSPASELLEDEKDKSVINILLDKIDAGNIGEAEDELYEMISDNGMEQLKMALIFYSHLNDKSDDFLLEHNFNREEIKLGLNDLTARYGLENVAEMFLEDE